jgi:hypothetical protein
MPILLDLGATDTFVRADERGAKAQADPDAQFLVAQVQAQV